MNRRFLKLTRAVSVAFWGGTILLLVFLTTRLVWRGTQMETGTQSIYTHWRDATLGWVVGDHEPIYSRQPSEQAEFWLRETNRVLEASPNDAQLTMGAAFVLDSPGDGFVWRFMKRLNSLPAIGTFPDLDREGIKQAEDVFENQCKDRCLELAATAAKLEPTNVEWWRLYALLLQRNTLHSYDATPRDPDWLNTLDECARHDPNNALYDYLAADIYWQAGAEMEFSGASERLVIKDGDKFKRGTARFERGQAKPCFAVGDSGFTAVADFLSHTKTPLTDHEHLVNSRGIHLRRSVLLHDVWRWQGLRATEQASAGDPTAALNLCRQNLHLLDQYEAAGASTAYDQVAITCKVASASQMQTFADALKGAMSDSERRQIASDREGANLQEEIVKCAARDLASSKNPPRVIGTMVVTGTINGPALVSALIVSFAPSVVVLLLLFTLLATILSRRLDDGDIPIIGPVGQVSTLAVSIIATAVLFGLAPAEIIGRHIQAWFFTAVLLLIPILFVSWIGWRWLRRRSFQFSIRDMLVFTFMVSLFFSAVAVVRPDEGFFSSFPLPLSVPARRWKHADAAVYANAITTIYGPWPWAVFQWIAYYGPYLTLALWASLSAALYRHKIGRMQRAEGEPFPPLRKRFGGFLRLLGRPVRVMATMMLVAYLLLAPHMLEQVEQEFQTKMAFARDPQDHWTKVAEAVQRVRSDEIMMSELQESAKAEAAKPTTPDSE